MSAEHDALERLRERWRVHLGRPLGGPVEAVGAVSAALWAHEYYADDAENGDAWLTPERRRDMRSYHPVPTRDDVLDALAQILRARAEVDRDEARLIDTARGHGVEWEEIGEALGYPRRSAKQSARARRASLSQAAQRKRYGDRWVRRRPLVVEQPAAPSPTTSEPEGSDT